MDNALLKASLIRWNDSFTKARNDLIPRRLVPLFPEGNLGLTISGVRRCGKTTLAVQLSKSFPESNVLYYNFEDPLFIGAQTPLGIDQLLSLFEGEHGRPPELFILDEIQNVDGWERWVRSCIDQSRSKVVVTGSNAKLLSAELATSLTGRALEFTAWPLSLSEIQDFFDKMHGDSPLPPPNRHYCLQQMLEWGALPAVLLTQRIEEREKILRQYLSDMIHRDIINRREVRNKRALDLLLTYYQTNLSSLHSYSSIKKAFGIPTDTVSDYTKALQDAFLVFEVERFHKNLKVQARDPRKIYVIDMGLRRVAARSPEADLGKRLENLVYLELRRKEEEIYYYQEVEEVDFIVTENYAPKAAIQVCAYGMDNPKTRDREVRALRKCLKDLDLSEGTIITMDRDEIISADGMIIRSVSAVEWFM